MQTPFVFGKIVEGNNFIDREKDTLHLKMNLGGGINTILISPRRWGKSSLVNHVAQQLKQDNPSLRFCFIDLFNVRSEAEFYGYFATRLIQATSTKWEEWVNNGKQFISRLIPQFSMGIDPVNDFKISFDWKELIKSPDEILELPQMISQKKDLRIVVCIDEFQNVANFDESLAFQRKLRSIWQKHQSATYCLYGSKRHMLANIFENKSMPFYKFGETLFLNKISETNWTDYIVQQFSETGKTISEELACKIPVTMENHPHFVQMLAKNVWMNTRENCTESTLKMTVEELLVQSSLMFQRELDNLTNKQINFLKALAEGVTQFSSKEALATFDLGAQSNIKKIKSTLENREIIDLWGDKIEFIDPLFRIWFRVIYLGKRLTV